MTIKRRNFYKGVRLTPTTDALTVDGEVSANSSDNKLKAQLGGSTRSVVTEDQSQTLTNKTINADNNTISNLEVDNLKSGVLDTDLNAVSGADDTIPSAKAVKAYVDAQIDTIDQAAEITYSNATSGLAATNVQTAIDEVDGNVDNLVTLSGVALDATNLGTFTGTTIPDNQTNKQALQALETSVETKAASSVVTEIDGNVDDLITLSGVAENSTSLGTFTGTTIPDSSTVKAALQSLETSLEEVDQNANDLITLSGVAENAASLGTFTGTTIPNSQTIKQALQSLETAHEAHLTDSSDAHDASAISNIPSGNLAATEVQAALNELQSDIDTRATSSALTTHTGASSGVHGITGSVVGTSDSQTLTNKTFSGGNVTNSDVNLGTASNSQKLVLSKNTFANLDSLTKEEASLYYATDTQALYYDNGTSLVAVPTSSGSGAFNYILNPAAETDTSGWATYADAAATTPVDGTGGAPTTTLTRITSSVLQGSGSFRITKDAANRQGEGARYAFTIATADAGKDLSLSFNYAASTNYADNDIRVYVYDVTNSTLISPTFSTVQKPTNSERHQVQFTSVATSTSYRLIIHIASTNASSYTFDFDNVNVGPTKLFNTEVFIKYNTNAGQSITNSSGTFNIIDFEDVVSATHPNAVTNPGGVWRFTAPVTGFYHVDCSIEFASATWTTADGLRLSVSKDLGTNLFANLMTSSSIGFTGSQGMWGSTGLNLVEGETVTIVCLAVRTGGSTNLRTIASRNEVTIYKI